ncbi:MAG: hypothetical protein V7711_00015 [Pseudomonadales bacterium]
MLAKSPDHINVEEAGEILADIAEAQSDNPEYQYLMAISFSKMEPRQLSKTVTHMHAAIYMGKELNWDVSDWEKQLDVWTTGGQVYIEQVSDGRNLPRIYD